HIVIVPKKHIPTITDVTLPDLHLINALFVAGNRIVEEEQIRDKGFRLVMNCRSDGGQTVDHLHLHLLGGRQMSWPPG
ncbi:MAG: HIT domain-containing protein, partial [Candidatus Omnitrophica bacterium]|nr:HIT domain-containing protein [Candidatus Omnitrophota bacterium]